MVESSLVFDAQRSRSDSKKQPAVSYSGDRPLSAVRSLDMKARLLPDPLSASAVAIVLAIASLLLTGCNPNTNLPVQLVIASVDGNRRAPNPLVTIHRSASTNRQTWNSNGLFTSSSGPSVDTTHSPTPFTTTINARGGGSPGIGSNGDYYVLAFWGRPSNVPFDATNVAMFVSVSHDGVAWTVPTPVTASPSVHSNTQGIVRSAELSVAPVGINGAWFASFADSSGTITIVPLPVTRSGFVDPNIPTTPTTITGATTNRSPALSYLNGMLVLAWRVPGSSGGVRILTSPDGTTWPNGSTATTALTTDANGASVPLAIEDSSPYLNNSLGDLFLASTAFLPQSVPGSGANAARLNILRSSDGINFTVVDTHVIGSPISADPAVAGPSAEYVAAFINPLNRQTNLLGPGINQRTINTEGAVRVSIAHGP